MSNTVPRAQSVAKRSDTPDPPNPSPYLVAQERSVFARGVLDALRSQTRRPLVGPGVSP